MLSVIWMKLYQLWIKQLELRVQEALGVGILATNGMILTSEYEHGDPLSHTYFHIVYSIKHYQALLKDHSGSLFIHSCPITIGLWGRMLKEAEEGSKDQGGRCWHDLVSMPDPQTMLDHTFGGWTWWCHDVQSISLSTFMRTPFFLCWKNRIKHHKAAYWCGFKDLLVKVSFFTPINLYLHIYNIYIYRHTIIGWSLVSRVWHWRMTLWEQAHQRQIDSAEENGSQFCILLVFAYARQDPKYVTA